MGMYARLVITKNSIMREPEGSNLGVNMLTKLPASELTRLEILCRAHNVQGGTIFQYNERYKEDFLRMPIDEFIGFINKLNVNIRYCNECELWEEK